MMDQEDRKQIVFFLTLVAGLSALGSAPAIFSRTESGIIVGAMLAGSALVLIFAAMRVAAGTERGLTFVGRIIVEFVVVLELMYAVLMFLSSGR